MKKPKLWYAIADGGRARFVERDENGAFRTVASFVSKDLHSRARDLGTDRPGRVMESATTGRSAIEPRQDPKEAAKEDFVSLVAEELSSEHERGVLEDHWPLHGSPAVGRFARRSRRSGRVFTPP